MNTSKAINILINICLLLPVTLSATGSKKDTLPLRDFASDLRYIPEMQARAADSIYQPGYGEVGELNLDTLFSRCAAIGYEAMPDQMEQYYVEVLDPIPVDADRAKEFERMREVIDRIGRNKLKRELEYGKAISLPDNTPEKRAKKIAVFRDIADKSIARKDPAMEMRALSYIFRKLYVQEQYYTAFLYAEQIIRRLEEISDADYPEKKNTLSDLGRVYYDFRDYERAVPYLKAALCDDPVLRYYDMSNIKARNVLGIYYRKIGELDSSDYYFRSILECKDRVNMRPMMDCIALSNLALSPPRPLPRSARAAQRRLVFLAQGGRP